MAVKFALGLQAYRLKRDSDVWFKYEPLSADDCDAFNQSITEADTAEKREAGVVSMLFSRIKEMWHKRAMFDDPEDIADTLAANPAMAIEMRNAIRGHEFTDDTTAPF